MKITIGVLRAALNQFNDDLEVFVIDRSMGETPASTIEEVTFKNWSDEWVKGVVIK